MGILKFPCGCEFETINHNGIIECDVYEFNKHPRLKIDIYEINEDCPITWDLLCSGNTKGCFQLGKSEGKQWSKKAKPRSIMETAHLSALLRPGCPPHMKEEYCKVCN